ncbi:ABC transporter substrate-binding protein [Tabrizicola oligotrophica]|uniref:ABC transporter substrate-binding protein n=1 Tax=Tabrizicola oligotrophica TaxID=2710650 RepID=A0A6M0QX15_9RHOB|nr:ABC transporter substrate-binding protein [Tabrizicola oligotrophica]NEY92038.1 ABC transporter substrate-binding protein [Tabrizicola oligotrophica]
MKHLLGTLLMGTALVAGPALADDIKIGILFGFTGPIESLTPPMADGAELAMKEAGDSGLFLGGDTVSSVRGDSTCTDASAATAAAERLVSVDKIAALVGADCSGVTTAVLNNVAVPNNLLMISPSATSPALAADTDKGLFFRTAPSDSRQGELLAKVLIDRGITKVAVTHTNNDYGKGFAEAFDAAYTAAGGTVTLDAPHDDGKADYSAEVSALSVAGGQALVVLGYADQGGHGIIQASLDSGAFDQFAVGDGMHSEKLMADFGPDLKIFGTVPWSTGEGAEKFAALAKAAGKNADSSFVRESYDAAALILLAMQAAGDPAKAAEKVMDVANAPGEKIYPGELAKGLQILKDGGEIDYVGGSDVEMIGTGESAGSYREFENKGGTFETARMLTAD